MNLEHLGWNWCAYPHPPDQSHGRISLASRDHFLVWTQNGEVEASLSGHLRHHNSDRPCVGDWVSLREGNVITQLLPRRTKLVRKQPGKEIREQILAANIDLLFIVTGLDHDYNPSRLERYLVLAYESGARPVILLNKADLRSDLESVIQATELHAPGVAVLALSAVTGKGIELISHYLQPAQTAALIGSSGAGKSTILNRLLGENRQTTSEVRDSDSKGRHTTTRRELVRMPKAGSSWTCLASANSNSGPIPSRSIKPSPKSPNSPNPAVSAIVPIPMNPAAPFAKRTCLLPASRITKSFSAN